jgi:hypothetical protein
VWAIVLALYHGLLTMEGDELSDEVQVLADVGPFAAGQGGSSGFVSY